MSRPRYPLALLALSWLLLAAGPAWGADEFEERLLEIAERAKSLPVEVTPVLGFKGQTPGSRFLPVVVTLRSREGQRRVELTLGGVGASGPLLRLGPVELEPGEVRRVRGLVAAHKLNELDAVHVVVREGDQVVGEATAEPKGALSQVLLVLDRRNAAPADFSSLKTFKSEGRATSERAWLVANLSSREELPTTVLGYSSVSCVLLGSLNPEGWEASQAQALAGWVRRGGHVILSLGKESAALKRSLLGQRLGSGLAPLGPRGEAQPGTGVQLSAFASSLGLNEAQVKSPPYVTPLRAGPGDRVLGRDDAGRPLVLQRSYGLGTLTLVACDLWSPPFLHSEGARTLTQRLLSTRVAYAPRTFYLFDELSRIQQPSQIGPAFALLILYPLVAGPLVYFYLRGKKRGILLWIAIPTLTLAFTSVLPLYRLALKKGESTLVGVRLIESRAGETIGVETLDAMLFSGSLDTKELSLKGADVQAFSVTPPTQRFRRKGRRWPLLGDMLGSAGPEGELSFELPVAVWGARYVSFERSGTTSASQGHVEISLNKAQADKVSVELTYQGTFPLRDPVVIFPHPHGALIHPIDQVLSPGTPYRVTNTPARQLTEYDANAGGLGSLMVSRVMLQPFKGQAERSGRAFLLGHTNDPPPLNARPNVRVRSFATVVAIELPLRYRHGVPWRTLQPEREASSVAGTDSQSVTRILESRFRLPQSAKSKPLTKLLLRGEARSVRVLKRAQLELHDATRAKWLPLDESLLEPNKGARSETEAIWQLKEPQRWASRDGLIRVRQRIERSRGESDSPYTLQLDLSARWDE